MFPSWHTGRADSGPPSFTTKLLGKNGVHGQAYSFQRALPLLKSNSNGPSRVLACAARPLNATGEPWAALLLQ